MKLEHLFQHEAKVKTTRRFLTVLTILVLYIALLTFKFGSAGLALGAITWSSLVLATPIADGGLVLDFPLRVLTGIRMIIAEIFVWITAIGINIVFLTVNPAIYHKTLITDTLKNILVHPWPNWIIVVLSCVGTFLSLYFGDELLDIVMLKDRKKYNKHISLYRLIVGIFLIFAFYFSYRYFLSLFGLKI